jgi:hypothetical protein
MRKFSTLTLSDLTPCASERLSTQLPRSPPRRPTVACAVGEPIAFRA